MALPTLEMPDTIGDHVHVALGALEAAMAHAAAGEHTAAAHAARRAHSHAEAAYSDPAVLAQLSFPQSHLFGVYAPLFLPLGVSVLQALASELLRARSKALASL